MIMALAILLSLLILVAGVCLLQARGFRDFAAEAGRSPRLTQRDFVSMLTSNSSRSDECYINGTRVSCDVLSTFVGMVAPTCGEGQMPPPEPIWHQNRKPFRIGIFGGSVSTGIWPLFLQKNLDILQVPARVENNAVGATSPLFWRTCPPRNRYDVVIGEWTLNSPNASEVRTWIAQVARISRYVVFLDLFAWTFSPVLMQMRAPDRYKRISLKHVSANRNSSCFVAFRDASLMWWRWMPPFTTRILFSDAPEECHVAAERPEPPASKAGSRDSSRQSVGKCESQYLEQMQHGGEAYQELVALAVSRALLSLLASAPASTWVQSPTAEPKASCYGTWGMKFYEGLPSILREIPELDALKFTMQDFKYGAVFTAHKKTMYTSRPGAVLQLPLPRCATSVSLKYVAHSKHAECSSFSVSVGDRSLTIRNALPPRPAPLRLSRDSPEFQVTSWPAKLTVKAVDVPAGNFVEITQVHLAGC
ncbi:unnamed protein product [Symbiodinium natans]|uniref:Uncharacterized protein n=1 Tax=Symbiodinium natans TaxID=878477 RepID=A0A812TSX9_9DINO|nr:unnamed protein product [Symbiodinium natans]